MITAIGRTIALTMPSSSAAASSVIGRSNARPGRMLRGEPQPEGDDRHAQHESSHGLVSAVPLVFA